MHWQQICFGWFNTFGCFELSSFTFFMLIIVLNQSPEPIADARCLFPTLHEPGSKIQQHQHYVHFAKFLSFFSTSNILIMLQSIQKHPFLPLCGSPNRQSCVKLNWETYITVGNPGKKNHKQWKKNKKQKTKNKIVPNTAVLKMLVSECYTSQRNFDFIWLHNHLIMKLTAEFQNILS